MGRGMRGMQIARVYAMLPLRHPSTSIVEVEALTIP